MAASWTRSSRAGRRRRRQPAPQPPNTAAPQPLFVFGRGNVGRTLARAFRAAGYRAELRPARRGIDGLVQRLRSAPGAIAFLAVPDDAILLTAGKLAGVGRA